MLFSNSFIFFFEKIKLSFSFFSYLKFFFILELLLVLYVNLGCVWILEILTFIVLGFIFLLTKKSVRFFFINLNLLFILNFLFISKSFFNFLLFLELLSFFTFIFLFFKSKGLLFKNNKVVFFFINANLISVFFFLLFLFNYFKFTRLSDYSSSAFITAFFNLFYVKSVFTFFFFVKIGLLSGPLFGLEVYKNLNNCLFNKYNVIYVVFTPFFFFKNFIFLFQSFFFFKIFLILILSNFFFLKKTYDFRSFLYYSSQVNIIYFSFFISIFAATNVKFFFY
jgi:hypothetical protein